MLQNINSVNATYIKTAQRFLVVYLPILNDFSSQKLGYRLAAKSVARLSGAKVKSKKDLLKYVKWLELGNRVKI